ncbi:MAG TPA: MFS transporter [Tepidisphaeraceae bacterium]|jgi:GPH family glycoside/pentoside/hexuronide:cation symporter|nr:MFS transporter [Tepidisphaeraceae bacterium]
MSVVTAPEEPSTAVTPTTKPLGTGRMVGWGLGGFVENQMSNGLVALVLPIYNVGLGINVVWLGWAMAIPRLLDALTDPFIGHMSDNTRSRLGRRRPWMIGGALLCAISFVLVWWPPLSWSDHWQFAWFAWFTAIGFLCAGLFAIPYNALGFEMTDDSAERTRLQGWRFFFIIISGLMVGWMYRLSFHPWFTGQAVEGVRPEVIGARWVAILCGLLILIFGLLPVFLCRERVEFQRQPRIRLKEAGRLTLRNRVFLRFVALVTISLLGVGLVGPLGLYISIYHVCQGDTKFAATIAAIGSVLSTGAAIGFIPVITWIAGRIGKVRTLMSGQVVASIGAASSWFLLRPDMPYLSLVPVVFYAFGIGCFLILHGSIMAEICDLDELHSGLRREGMYGAVSAFVGKLVASLLTVVSGYVLVISGYREGATQSADAIWNMRALFAFVPAACLMIGLALTLRFPVTTQSALQVRTMLEARRVERSSGEA